MNKNKVLLNHRQIAEILPHRYPFLLVDKIIHLDLDNDEIKPEEILCHD